MSAPVGLVGVGRMGERIGGRLLAAGRGLVVHDRDPAAARRLTGRGAAPADTPAEVAARCGTVLTAVTDGPAVLAVLTGPDGLLRAPPPGLLLVETTTIGVAESERVAARCAAAGVRYVRCPVLGSLAAAAEGRLVALMSGPPDAVEAAAAVVGPVAAVRHVLGTGEEARVAKLAANGVLAGSLLALLEGVVLAERCGLPRDRLLGALDDSSVVSPFLRGAAARLRAARHEPNLTMDLLVKDLLLAEAAADRVAATLPVAGASRRVFQAAAGSGLGGRDPIAVVDVLAAAGRPGGVEPDRPG